MSGFIDNTSNIDAAEIAAEYRTPEQGVSAKSNSNVAWNDYKIMTPRANQANGVRSSTSALQAQDFGGTAGFTPGARTFSTGSTKGATNTTVAGAFTLAAYDHINISNQASAAVGHFGLGAQGGQTGISLTNVASFPSGCTLTGYGTSGSGGLATSLFYIITSGASGATNWTKVHHRILQPNGVSQFGNTTIYNYTLTFNRSDFTYNGNINNNQEKWQLSFGGFSGVTGPTMIYPFAVEFE